MALGILLTEILIIIQIIFLLDGNQTKENTTTVMDGIADYLVNSMDVIFIMIHGIRLIGTQVLVVQDIIQEQLKTKRISL